MQHRPRKRQSNRDFASTKTKYRKPITGKTDHTMAAGESKVKYQKSERGNKRRHEENSPARPAHQPDDEPAELQKKKRWQERIKTPFDSKQNRNQTENGRRRREDIPPPKCDVNPHGPEKRLRPPGAAHVHLPGPRPVFASTTCTIEARCKLELVSKTVPDTAPRSTGGREARHRPSDAGSDRGRTES
ncbi:hypothetical protein DFP72DRAFT_848184 [Ephemerocybe angulata]|uniref:Uncharacterized protein n=1 Tax=Ephemerocybe angulata TaxID=980116 RepID=A0A8H6M4W9_9AGAR|nr:hypothetical protein DFP72DRAFT_848184 [Tulosesus angulatus]